MAFCYKVHREQRVPVLIQMRAELLVGSGQQSVLNQFAQDKQFERQAGAAGHDIHDDHVHINLDIQVDHSVRDRDQDHDRDAPDDDVVNDNHD